MKKCWCGNRDLKNYSDGYYQCDNCGTLISKTDFQDSLYNVEKEDEDLYGKQYWEVAMARVIGKNNLSEVVDLYLTERVLYWMKYVLKYIRLGSSVAEVGCGLGQLQFLLKHLQYNQLAFELSPYICKYMEDTLGIRTHCGSFVENKDAYDGILAFDLFEHLIEPLAFADQCANSLKEEGVLCLQTPCYDAGLTYEEMIKKKSRYQSQLRPEQHIYLYSRESITALLKKYGFEFIVFEPAFFGDDYDMFLFASRKPMQINSAEEIDKYLNSVPSGRLIKAMITLFDEKEKKEAECQSIDIERQKMLKDVKLLTELNSQKQKEVDEFQYAAEQRLADNRVLTQIAEERLQLINKLREENEL